MNFCFYQTTKVSATSQNNTTRCHAQFVWSSGFMTFAVVLSPTSDASNIHRSTESSIQVFHPIPTDGHVSRSFHTVDIWKSMQEIASHAFNYMHRVYRLHWGQWHSNGGAKRLLLPALQYCCGAFEHKISNSSISTVQRQLFMVWAHLKRYLVWLYCSTNYMMFGFKRENVKRFCQETTDQINCVALNFLSLILEYI